MSLAVDRRKALVFAATLGSIALLGHAARPHAVDPTRAGVPLGAMFPVRLDGWHVSGASQAFVQLPDEGGRIHGIYDQVLQRLYVNGAGDSVMLCVAYGSDQSPALQLHNPDVCYASMGFQVADLREDRLLLPERRLPVKRMHASTVGRSEPVTYWTVFGDRVTSGSAGRWRQWSLRPDRQSVDGMLVRISSIDRNAARGFRLHEQFATDLLRSVPPEYRARIFGAADSRVQETQSQI